MENTTSTAAQYLTFTLDQEHYAVDIGKVREVLEFTSLTRLPRAPAFLRGMINLRGSVVPVIDLRLKFGMSRTEKTVDTCVIITEIPLDGEQTVLGALADSVQEVIELDTAQIEPPPRMGTRVGIDFIRGMGKRENDFLIILDIEKVLSEQEMRAVALSAASAPAQPEQASPAA
jgi:purine-binding chemotaxis protein CheW